MRAVPMAHERPHACARSLVVIGQTTGGAYALW